MSTTSSKSAASAPLVSVVIATYNRSNILRFAIESVRRQTFRDWEMIVVGDACTDDTAQVVAELARADARIRFYNLEQNVGEQSGPNNFGCRQARGRFIAFLNHDDMWLPDHLAAATAAIQETGADIVHTLLDMVRSEAELRNPIYGIWPVTWRRPPGDTPASSWLLRRELLEEIGEWRFCRECYNVPSQDWLFRVWKSGKKIFTVPRLTVVAISSASSPARVNSYKDRHCHEHEEYFARICNEADFRVRELAVHEVSDETELLARAARDKNRPLLHPRRTFPRRLARWAFYSLIKFVALQFRCDPVGAEMWMRYRGRKGGCIDALRRVRGLPQLGDKKTVDSRSTPVGE